MDAIYDYRLPSPDLSDYVRQLQIIGCTFPQPIAILPVKVYWPWRSQYQIARTGVWRYRDVVN